MSAGGGQKKMVALVGNPNVGKSTLFNTLTGLRRHTGNWSGKTVDLAVGKLRGGSLEFVDLPGTYSLSGQSEDEKIAADYIISRQADCLVVVCDAGALERNLILALQVLQQDIPAVLCVNMIDEARHQGMQIHKGKLSQRLGIPVVFTSAAGKEGLKQLLAEIRKALESPVSPRRKWEDPVAAAQQIAAECVCQGREENWRLELDKVLVSRRRGIPILLTLLFVIVWLTVWGANYPSMLLQRLFDGIYQVLEKGMGAFPWWLRGFLLDGVYDTAARVMSVMLPPMAIFFPLFTILEDVGYLPRMAFLLDGKMRRCGGCGKQALTLCMGLGCNAVGVMGCRIIDSPRERLLAILTNAMVPCNGRFPALILLGGLICGSFGPVMVAGAVVLGVLGAMVTSGVLSRTALKHEKSLFLLELPPLRRPRFGQILVRSVLDRTLQVAARALTVAAPAGGVIWILANAGLLGFFVDTLEPLGQIMGMNGAILLAFFLALPANELLIPLILLIPGGNLEMGWPMALCTMIFTVFHWPCATTLQTIYRETGSLKKTAAAFFLPTAVGMVLCMVLNGIVQHLCC